MLYGSPAVRSCGCPPHVPPVPLWAGAGIYRPCCQGSSSPGCRVSIRCVCQPWAWLLCHCCVSPSHSLSVKTNGLSAVQILHPRQSCADTAVTDTSGLCCYEHRLYPNAPLQTIFWSSWEDARRLTFPHEFNKTWAVCCWSRSQHPTTAPLPAEPPSAEPSPPPVCVTPRSSPRGRGEHNHFKRQCDTNHGPPSPQVPTSAGSAGTARPGVCTCVSLCPWGAGGWALLHAASPSPVAMPMGQAPRLILQQRTWAPHFCPNASPKMCWNTRKPRTWAPEETVLSDLFIFLS